MLKLAKSMNEEGSWEELTIELTKLQNIENRDFTVWGQLFTIV